MWPHYGPNKSVVLVPETEGKLSGINEITVGESSPEKAGVGGSIPSLATMFSSTYQRSLPRSCSILFQFHIRGLSVFALQNGLVAGDCNAPNALFLPFRLELSQSGSGIDRVQP